jgi:Protein of unknown function (DUF3144)
MSEKKNVIPNEFFEVVDRFINLANELGADWPRSRVSATLMYAAARYNVFNWLTREVDLNQTLDEAVDYYAREYEKMFRDNVEELTPHYKDIKKPSDAT